VPKARRVLRARVAALLLAGDSGLGHQHARGGTGVRRAPPLYTLAFARAHAAHSHTSGRGALRATASGLGGAGLGAVWVAESPTQPRWPPKHNVVRMPAARVAARLYSRARGSRVVLVPAERTVDGRDLRARGIHSEGA